MPSVHLLGNPTTSGGREQLNGVAEAFERVGVTTNVIAASTVADSRAAARRVVADGATLLVAVGGDGVANIAVDAAAESETVLGIVPLGTGNDFARALGLRDGDVDQQVERALAAPVPIDALRTNHGWVATVATLGFSGDVTARANALSWPRGQLRYTLATLLQLPRLRTLPVTVDVEGTHVSGDTTLLAIGNTAFFGGGMRICPGVEPDDGRLQIVSIGDVPRRTFLRVFPSVFSGRHVDRPEVTTAIGTSAAVDGPAIDVWADGDRLGPLPLYVEVVPGAVLVAGVGPA